MLEFLAQYWLEFALGIITAGLAGLARYFWSLFKKHLKDTLTNEISSMTTQLQKTMEANDNKLTNQIDHLGEKIGELEEKAIKTANTEKGLDNGLDKLEDDLKALKKGVLSIQKQQFVKTCRKLINQEEPIQLEQFEKITAEHRTYNLLGGNHDGDELYKLVTSKYNGQLEHNK